jgi:hypothetical protein
MDNPPGFAIASLTIAIGRNQRGALPSRLGVFFPAAHAQVETVWTDAASSVRCGYFKAETSTRGPDSAKLSGDQQAYKKERVVHFRASRFSPFSPSPRLFSADSVLFTPFTRFYWTKYACTSGLDGWSPISSVSAHGEAFSLRTLQHLTPL